MKRLIRIKNRNPDVLSCGDAQKKLYYRGKRAFRRGRRAGIPLTKESQNVYQACIFDLDGTIADTLESIAHVSNQVLEHFHMEPQPVEDFKYFAGDGADMLMERCFAAASGKRENLKEAQQMYRDVFRRDPLYRVKPFEGMTETLAELKRRGVKLAVCSNKPHEAAVGCVEGLFGSDLFDVVLGQKPEIPRKPAPDAPLLIAERFGIKPQDCIYAGDTNTDMQTGKAAGMYTVGVLWGFRTREELEENHADTVIEKPEDLLALQKGEKP